MVSTHLHQTSIDQALINQAWLAERMGRGTSPGAGGSPAAATLPPSHLGSSGPARLFPSIPGNCLQAWEAPRFCWGCAERSTSPTAGSPWHGRGPGTHTDPIHGTWAHRVRASRQWGARETISQQSFHLLIALLWLAIAMQKKQLPATPRNTQSFPPSSSSLSQKKPSFAIANRAGSFTAPGGNLASRPETFRKALAAK